jgi:hypothetical protein
MEVILGVALLIKYRMKITVWVLLLLIVFFTFLTFYSAFFNKVTDCGCFGDAIPLSPWQSFGKDLILLVLSLYLLIRWSAFKPAFSPRVNDTIIIIATMVCGFLAIYAIEHLPFIDFRNYSVGTSIPEAMNPSEPLRYTYIMEKDGNRVELEKYPADTTYTFVEMVLLNPEAQPKITDYSIWNEDGDLTEESFNGTKLLLVFYDVSKARTRHLVEMVNLATNLKNDLDVWVVTSNDEFTYESFRHEHQIPIPYYYIDGTVAEALIRANPGLVLLDDGVVKGKWHNNDIPNVDEIRQLMSSD